MDVDGVLTDGRLLISQSGEETKAFHVADGLGIQLLRHAGIRVVWISGRSSAAVQARATELNIDELIQGVSNKAKPLAEMMAKYSFATASIAYMGDDLNDLTAFSVAGVKFAPSNAALEIKAAADFITERVGGSGAVREMADTILKAQNTWNDSVSAYLSSLLKEG
jgi:3-deoxy-D-manno-octulosonate 8-phosphate phosphatase (KDO 8-P phosphatase)